MAAVLFMLYLPVHEKCEDSSSITSNNTNNDNKSKPSDAAFSEQPIETNDIDVNDVNSSETVPLIQPQSQTSLQTSIKNSENETTEFGVAHIPDCDSGSVCATVDDNIDCSGNSDHDKVVFNIDTDDTCDTESLTKPQTDNKLLKETGISEDNSEKDELVINNVENYKSQDQSLNKNPSSSLLSVKWSKTLKPDNPRSASRPSLSLARTFSVECVPLEQAVQGVLAHLNIHRDVWKRTDDTNMWQVSFVVPSHRSEEIIQSLSSLGVGRIKNTTLSLFPADCYHTADDGDSESVSNAGSSDKSEFVKSVKSRLIVAKVVDSVQANASLTFDFVMFVILASMIAGLGLVEGSSVILVASMLVSPIMGPIVGGTFGVVIHNRQLWRKGLRNESISLLLCLIWGFIFGLGVSCINKDGVRWAAGGQWPTDEMQSRGLLRSLWVGALVALPSGAGVALSILGGNAGSLVGVAISASLLPPAVNAGMLWATALVSAIIPPPRYGSPAVSVYETAISNNSNQTYQTVTQAPSLDTCPSLVDNEYDFAYRCDMASEAAILGSVSLLLTLINILCIIIMGILILKLKEVAPHVALQKNEAFWKRDIKVARDLYRTLKGEDATHFAEMARVITHNQDERWQELLAKLHEDKEYQALWLHVTKQPLLPEEVIPRKKLQSTPSTLSNLEPQYITMGADKFHTLDMMEWPSSPQVKPGTAPAETANRRFTFHYDPKEEMSESRKVRQRLRVPRIARDDGNIKPSTTKGRFQVTAIEDRVKLAPDAESFTMLQAAISDEKTESGLALADR